VLHPLAERHALHSDDHAPHDRLHGQIDPPGRAAHRTILTRSRAHDRKGPFRVSPGQGWSFARRDHRAAPRVGLGSGLAALAVGDLLDLLLANLLGDLLLTGHGLGAEADPLDRDGLLGHDGLLGLQHDLVLLLGQLPT